MNYPSNKNVYRRYGYYSANKLWHTIGESVQLHSFKSYSVWKSVFREDVDIQALLQDLPIAEVQIAVKENQVYWRSLPNSAMLKEYRVSQKRFDFYIPTVEEIEMLLNMIMMSNKKASRD